MKKICLRTLLISIFVLCIMLMTSCAERLSAPKDFSVDAKTVTLSWKKVSGARSYTIAIAGEEREKTTKTNSVSLEYLPEGTYEISVKALGDGVDTKDSKWATYTFIRERETGLKFKLINNDTEYELVGGGTATGNVVMESFYRGKPVTSIADKALYNNSKIEKFTVGTEVRSIGAKAFAKCSKLTTVIFPEELNIASFGENTFQSSKALTSITLPKSLTAISPFMFSYCVALESITVGDKIATVGEYAFSNCKLLGAIKLPDTVKSIGEYAFSDCEVLADLQMGNGVENIDNYAFANCLILEDLTISSNIDRIGEHAFDGCVMLTSVEIPDSAAVIADYAFFGCTALADVKLGAGLTSVGFKSFAATAFYDSFESLVYIDGWVIDCKDKEITSVVIPEGAYGIAESAYAGCSKIESVKIKGVKYVCDYAFNYCKTLWEIIFDDSLLTLGHCVFLNSPALSDVKVGNSLKSIGDSAFNNCPRLLDIKLPDSLESVGTDAFYKTLAFSQTPTGIVYVGNWAVGVKDGNYTNLQITNGTRGIANYALSGVVAIYGIEIPDSVIYVGRGAFYQATTMSIKLSESTKIISDYAFYGCSYALFGNDGYLRIPSTVEYIGRSAFYQCTSIISLYVPASVKTIGPFAFYQCTNLGMVGEVQEDGSQFVGEVVLNEGLESIGMRAFQGCSSLVSIALPNSLMSLGSHSFYKCEKLATVTMGTGITEIGEYTFYACSALTDFELNGSVKSIGTYAFKDCTSLTAINLDGVETIGDFAFYKCTSLTKIEIPSSVKVIGNYTFRNCSGVSALIIPSTVEQIGKHAFYGLKDATIYCDAETIKPLWDNRFNSSYRPSVWGCTLSEDGSYVVSFVKTETSVSNPAVRVISDPIREGYTFGGWTAEIEGEVKTFTSETVSEAPVGTTLTAIWNLVTN